MITTSHHTGACARGDAPISDRQAAVVPTAQEPRRYEDRDRELGKAEHVNRWRLADDVTMSTASTTVATTSQR